MDASAGQIHVGIIEPYRVARSALSQLLSDAGCHVVGEFGDVRAFLDQRTSQTLHVALVHAPRTEPAGVDLVGVLRLLKQRCLSAYALVLSDGAEASEVQHCYEEGAAGYLDKRSADGHAIVHAVRAVAHGERMFPVDLLSSPFQMETKVDEPAPLRAVSIRERDVLSCLAAGADNLKIATLLRISERTVKAHISSLYRKLGAENRTQLALTALQLGLRPSPQV